MSPFRTTAALALLLCSCAEVGPFVWADDYREPPQEMRGFVIAPGDSIDVRMFDHDNFNTRASVRSDGMVTLPLLGDVQAAGYTPSSLGQQLEVRYKDYVKVPAITVSVTGTGPLSIPVAGEVGKAGIVSADRNATLLQVLLLAGGLTDFAHDDRVFVVRGSPPTRIRFRWKAMLRGGTGARFPLAAGDTVVVE